MTFGSCAPKAWSKRACIPAVISSFQTAIRSVPETYEELYDPLTAGILQPFTADRSIPREKITARDCRYTAVIQALDDLVDAIGLKAA
jgi:hypothetical protein